MEQTSTKNQTHLRNKKKKKRVLSIVTAKKILQVYGARARRKKAMISQKKNEEKKKINEGGGTVSPPLPSPSFRTKDAKQCRGFQYVSRPFPPGTVFRSSATNGGNSAKRRKDSANVSARVKRAACIPI